MDSSKFTSTDSLRLDGFIKCEEVVTLSWLLFLTADMMDLLESDRHITTYKLLINVNKPLSDCCTKVVSKCISWKYNNNNHIHTLWSPVLSYLSYANSHVLKWLEYLSGEKLVAMELGWKELHETSQRRNCLQALHQPKAQCRLLDKGEWVQLFVRICRWRQRCRLMVEVVSEDSGLQLSTRIIRCEAAVQVAGRSCT